MVRYEAESLRLVAVQGLSLTLHFNGLCKLIPFDCCLPSVGLAVAIVSVCNSIQ